MTSGNKAIAIAVISMVTLGLGIEPMRTAQAAPKEAAAPAGGGGANPTGEWQGGPLGDKDGHFAYCVTENRFSNGRALSVARNPKGEFAVVIAQPGGKLPAGKSTSLTLKIDKIERKRVGNFRNEELMEIPMGGDEEFFGALSKGKTLVVAGPNDSLTFALKGIGKALGALKECVTLAAAGKPVPQPSAGKPPAGASAGAASGGPVPRELANVLKAAGMGAVVPVGGGANPVWGFGPVLGVVEQVKVKPGTTIEELSTAFGDGVKKRCRGETDIDFATPETIGKGTVRKGEVKCASDKASVYLALLIHLETPDNVFIYTHEADGDHRSQAEDARDRMLDTIRKVATAKP